MTSIMNRHAGSVSTLLLAFGLASANIANAQNTGVVTPPTGPMQTHSLYEGAEARGQWPNSTHYAWPEIPSPDRKKIEIWGYTDATSYAPGDTVQLHISTAAAQYDLTVVRDGGEAEVVLEEKGLAGQWHTTPEKAFYSGPGWPVAHRIEIPDTWRSGGYVITLSVTNEGGQRIEQEAFFILRAKKPSPDAIAFVSATSTWQAYNDWGGANYYEGIGGPDGIGPATTTTTSRPWARGQIRLPEGAPRVPVTGDLPIGAAPRYPNLEWAYARGYSKYSGGAGWASFDVLFARWAERNGYELHYFAQDDLGRIPGILKGYKTVVMVGHDEYHTREERTAIDTFVENGGHLARFAGNQIWQARRENGRLVCYKSSAEEADPVRNDPEKRHLLTSIWEAKGVDWPPAKTWGANGVRGIYAKIGGFSPRASGGFTVYRPKHWALEGTDLYYGDIFGADANLVGYEGDGVTYGFRHGLPYATGEDGAPTDLEIIAMALAGTAEEDHGNPGTYLYAGSGDMHFLAKTLYGDDSEENLAKVRYGSVMMVNMKKGEGEVFNAATTEWVNGLKQRDPFVEIITRNVLDRFQAN